MRTARAAGRWQRIERRADAMPYLVYMLGPSLEHRDSHRALEGIILPVSDAFWSTHYPPNGWGCKCRTRQITRRERTRLLDREPDRYRADAPEPREVSWVNPATGEERTVTAGIDPGWDHNPGRHRTLGIHRREAERAEAVLSGRALETETEAARERLVRARIGQSLERPGFRRYVNRPRPDAAPRREARPEFVEVVPVAVAPEPLRRAADVSARLLYLTEPVADKQWRRHGPGQHRPTPGRTVPLAWWVDIQDIIDTIVPVRQSNGRWRYDDTARGRRLIVDRHAPRRLVVISYHPRKRPRGPEAARP